MAFKLTNPPYKVNQTPVYHVDMEEGVMGKANNNLTIIINQKLDPRMKYGHEEFDYDIASDAGVFDKELSADRKIRRAQKRYRRKTK